MPCPYVSAVLMLSRALPFAPQDETITELLGRPRVAVAAYVTFEREEGAALCLAAYSRSGVMQAAERRLRKRFPLLVRLAPEPSDILFENIEVSSPPPLSFFSP